MASSLEAALCLPTASSNEQVKGRKGDGDTHASPQRSCFQRSQMDPVVVASELVNGLRATTGLEHCLSKTAVRMLLQSLSSAMELHDALSPIIAALSEDEAAALISSGEDITQLNSLLQDLSSRKDDFQQRNWHLHDDKAHIDRTLTDLLTLLGGAEPLLCVHALMQSNARHLEDLVLYYQMETRTELKTLLLRVYAAIVELDNSKLVATLLSTVLPSVLAADVMHSPDEGHALDSAVLLTQLLSSKEELPRTHYDVLNRRFAECLLEKIEGEDERLSDVCMFLLLAFNQHVDISDNRLVLDALLRRSESTNLTEKILILFNRDDDVVSIGETGCKVVLGSATTKFLLDLFSTEETANLFYTNDTNVLIDVLVRQIHDLPANDEKRATAMSLMLRVLRCTDYGSNQHKKHELVAALRHIEATCSPATTDRQLANEIKEVLVPFL